jgi:hypothetical protein
MLQIGQLAWMVSAGPSPAVTTTIGGHQVIEQRIPVSFEAEYRGRAPGGDFVDRKTGEKVDYAEKLKFELDQPDGDVGLVVLGIRQFDDVADFDGLRLVKGDTVRIEGTVVLGQTNSYLRVVKVEPVKVTAVKASPAAA